MPGISKPDVMALCTGLAIAALRPLCAVLYAVGSGSVLSLRVPHHVGMFSRTAMPPQMGRPPVMIAPARYFSVVLLFAASSALWATVFFYFEAPLTGLLLVCLMVAGLVGVVHATVFKQYASWRPYLLFSAGLINLSVVWSVGPEASAFVALPALLLPQAILTTGGSKLQVIGSAAVFSTCFVAIRVLFAVGPTGPEDIKRVPELLREVFGLLCLFGPLINELSCMMHLLGELSAHKAGLEHTLREAELICHGLIHFDLDQLPPPPPEAEASASGRIVLMLRNVVERMKLFQPFLPHYLLAPMGGAGADPPGRYAPSRSSLASHPNSDPNSIDRGSAVPTNPGDSPRGFPGNPGPCALAAAHSSWRKAYGTLAVIALPGLQGMARAGDGLCRAKEVSDAFFEVVVPVILQSRGAVISLSGDQCLAGWNMASRCASHVQTALTAALEIRDKFAAVADAAAAMLSIGVCADEWVSGHFGTQELRMYGTYACQTASAVTLQRYAEATGRCIIVNDGVWQAVRDTHRLLPVDVVQLSPTEPRSGGEIISECVATRSESPEEWLYAVGRARADSGPALLHHVFAQLKGGLRTADEVRALQCEMVQLVDVEDRAIQDIGRFLMSLLKVQEPYCVRPQAFWGWMPRTLATVTSLRGDDSPARSPSRAPRTRVLLSAKA